MARQFVNDPQNFVAEGLAGLERAHPRLVRWNREPSFVIRADNDRPAKVAVLSGGGSGHEPLHTGFVGRGMLDAAVPGGIFASPTAAQIKAEVTFYENLRNEVKQHSGDAIDLKQYEPAMRFLLDTYIRAGKYGPRSFPFTPGSDAAGVIHARYRAPSSTGFQSDETIASDPTDAAQIRAAVADAAGTGPSVPALRHDRQSPRPGR